MSEPFQPAPVVFTPKRYPVIAFLVRWGHIVAYVLGAIPLIASIIFFMNQSPAWVLLVGAGASAVMSGFLLSYVELVRIIDDMLLPQ